ncbi:MAG: GNAT family N-acetyltransferase [Cyclobacteriaceae bacterium]
MPNQISYRSNSKITVRDFIDLLKRSTLDLRRPVNEPDRVQKMLDFGNVLITAWKDDELIGVSRALTDFSFCCYLSDLAVDATYQHQGIGKELVHLTHEAAGMQTMLILLAAPDAVDYYPKIGMTGFPHCFVLNRKD